MGTAMEYRVLVVGYRKGLALELEKREIPYVIYDEKLQKKRKALYLCNLSLSKDKEKIQQVSSELAPYGPFSHVIAGTENAVYIASLLRRALKARLSVNSTVVLCHDKWKMKQFLQQHDIAMNDFLQCSSDMSPSYIVEKLGSPVVIKDRNQSGGRGIIISDDLKVIKKHINRNKIAERYIDAPEYSVESFVHHSNICFSNITQYYQKKYINVVPAMLEETQQILRLNEKVIRALKISWGITHLEIYLSKDGPIFGEIALRPPGGYIMELMTLAYGFNSWAAYLAVELGEDFTFPVKHSQHTAAIVLHPGAGKITKIEGAQEMKDLPYVHSCKIKAKEGNVVKERGGVGEDIGHILLATQKDKLVNAIDVVTKKLRVIME